MIREGINKKSSHHDGIVLVQKILLMHLEHPQNFQTTRVPMWTLNLWVD